MDELNEFKSMDENSTTKYNSNGSLNNSPAFEIHDNLVPITIDEYMADGMDKLAHISTNTDSNKISILKTSDKSLPTDSNGPMEKLSITDKDDFWKIVNESTIYDLIPKSNKVIVLDVGLKVKNAFYALHTYESRGALLWNSTTSQFDGMFTVTDFITTILSKHPHFESITEIENSKITIWRDIGCVNKKSNNGLIYVTPDFNLNEAYGVLSQYRIHRLATLDEKTFNPIYIVTHKRILHYIYLKTKGMKLPNFFDLTLSELNIGTYNNIHTISYKTTIRDALSLLIEHSISALPVVDDNNRLVDIYSKSDASILAHDRNYTMLDNAITSALLHRQLGCEGVIRCKLTDTFRYVIKRIVKGRVHRLVVVNEHNNVIGVVSLSDILAYNPYKTSS